MQSAGTVTEFDGRRSNGEMFPVEASFSGWQGTEGYQYGAILRDISVRKREAEKIRYLAEHDTLTGLANRYTLDAMLAAMIARAESEGGEVALLVIGLDGFQQINDTLGHSSGDLVLQRGRRAPERAGGRRRDRRAAERRRIRDRRLQQATRRKASAISPIASALPSSRPCWPVQGRTASGFRSVPPSSRRTAAAPMSS